MGMKKGQRNSGSFPKGVLSTPRPIQKGQRLNPATEFKKGVVPKNKLPVGSVTVRQQKGDGPRGWVKVAEPNVWVPRAVHVWMQNGGTIPEGFIIHHENENTLDDRIENLACVKRGHHAKIHREKLTAAKKGMVLPKKAVSCSQCGTEYTAKKKGGLCDDCFKQRRREARRRYKQRLRSGGGRAGPSDPSEGG